MLTIRRQLTLLVLLFVAFNLIQPAFAATRIEPNLGGPVAALDAAKLDRDLLHALKHESDGKPFKPSEYRKWMKGDNLVIEDDAKPDHGKSMELIAEDARLHGKKAPAPKLVPPTCPPPTADVAKLNAANATIADQEKQIARMLIQHNDDVAAQKVLKAENDQIPGLNARIAELERQLKGQAPTPKPPAPKPPAPKGPQSPKAGKSTPTIMAINQMLVWAALLLFLAIAGLLVAKKMSNRSAAPPASRQTYNIAGQATRNPAPDTSRSTRRTYRV